METPRNGSRVAKKTEYYYDLPSGSLLVGRVALDAFIESGGHPADIVSLKEALLDKDLRIECTNYHNLDPFTKEQAVTIGRWLTSVINEDGQRESLTARRLETAYQLGLNYSPHQIRSAKNFQTIVAYQEALGSESYHRKSHFDEMSLDDLVNHVRRVSQEENKKATMGIFDRRVKEGKHEPTARIIRRLIKLYNPSLTLHDLYEMAGYSETTQHWSNERYEIWGEEYIWANKGRFPSADALSDAARNRIGPSQGGVRNRYSSISAYHDTLEARFREKFNKYMDDIVSGITENRLPIDLIAHTKSEWVVAKRFLKYSLLENVYPDLSVLEKTSIYHLLNDYAGYRLAKDRPDIDISRLEEEARKQGVYAAIWPKRSGLIRLEKRKSTARQFIADTGKLNQISRRGIQAKKVRRPSIGSVPVLDTKLLENGFVLNVLAPSPRAEPIRPDSEQAKSIIKRVRDTRYKQSYTIFSAVRD